MRHRFNPILASIMTMLFFASVACAGAAGPQGPVGAAGPQGEAGPAGASVSSAEIQALEAKIADLERASKDLVSNQLATFIEFQNPDQSFVEGHPQVVGSSASITRTLYGAQQELELSASTKGLQPNYSYTVWWVIFNEPSLCSDECGEDDLPPINPEADPGVMASAMLATGGTTDGDGNADFGATLKEGSLSPFVLFGPGLLDAEKAEVHIVFRDHGPIVPGLGKDQVSTFFGGCSLESLPGFLSSPEGLGTPGDYFCYEPQAAVLKMGGQ